jgi:hypothetical protein
MLSCTVGRPTKRVTRRVLAPVNHRSNGLQETFLAENAEIAEKIGERFVAGAFRSLRERPKETFLAKP